MKEKKILSTKEVAAILEVPLVTVQRWIHQGKIPCKIKGKEYQFKRNELTVWARDHHFSIIPREASKTKEGLAVDHSLSQAIRQGGVTFNLPGNDIYTILKNGIKKISFSIKLDKNDILDKLLCREEVASTGIGNGVAIPHPRSILELNLKQPLMPTFFLEKEIDYNSVDGIPVFVLFFMFSPSTNIHLKLLSKLSYCLRDKNFSRFLRTKPDETQLLGKIEEIEKKFGRD